MNYYPHHIGDYARKTAHLTFAEDAAYRRMLDLYYSSERPLPGNRAGLYRLLRARSKEEQRAVDTVLLEFFEQRGEAWHNDRADEEIARWQAKADKARQSAGVRWQSERNANALPETCDPPSVGNANHNQNQNHKEKTKARSAFAPPEWIPADAWKAFEEHRNKIRKGMTDKARSLIVAELEKLKPADPVAVLEQSIRNGWQDVFPLRTNGAAGKPAFVAPAPAQRVCRACKLPILGTHTDGMHESCWEAR